MTGTRMATMMMMPPMVGTPFFSTPNGSMLASRCTSEMFLLFMYLINFSPNHAEMTSESIRARSDLKEMYDHIWAPVIPNWSRNLNR